MNHREEIDYMVSKLKGRDLVVEGSRNNDMVNLCILAVLDNGMPESERQLMQYIWDSVEKHGLSISYTYDRDYMHRKAGVIYTYLPSWEDNLVAYAI